jgi:hypothetical protein
MLSDDPQNGTTERALESLLLDLSVIGGASMLAQEMFVVQFARQRPCLRVS